MEEITNPAFWLKHGGVLSAVAMAAIWSFYSLATSFGRWGRPFAEAILNGVVELHRDLRTNVNSIPPQLKELRETQKEHTAVLQEIHTAVKPPSPVAS